MNKYKMFMVINSKQTLVYIFVVHTVLTKTGLHVLKYCTRNVLINLYINHNITNQLIHVYNSDAD